VPLPGLTETDIAAWLSAVMLPFLRIGAMLVAAPLFGARTVPVRVRVILALAVAVLVAPLFPAAQPAVLFSAAGLLAMGGEIVLGLGLGFLVQMMFAAFAMAGEIVALSTGLAFATLVDPDRGGSVPLVGQYYVIFSTLLFLAFDGHLALLALVMHSFEPVPAGAVVGSAESWWQLAAWGSDMYRGAVLVAMPAAAALLLANVAMGLVARSAPQLNIFAVGFPVTLLLGMLFLLLTLPTVAPQVVSLFSSVLERGGALLLGAAVPGVQP
jgi:flagellar biosynthesis protein FliR